MKRIVLVCMMMAIASLYAKAQTKDCDNCHGTGLEERTCAFCSGQGIRESDFCLGKKLVRCNDCGGEGKVFCAHCRGKGGVQVKDEWRECQWCGGQGTPDCEKCKKTGQLTCWKCNGVGHYECNQCHGSKASKWQCHVCGGSGKVKADVESVTSKLSSNGYSGTVKVQFDPNDSQEERMRKIARARLAHRKKQMEAQGITVK